MISKRRLQARLVIYGVLLLFVGCGTSTPFGKAELEATYKLAKVTARFGYLEAKAGATEDEMLKKLELRLAMPSDGYRTTW